MCMCHNTANHITHTHMTSGKLVVVKSTNSRQPDSMISGNTLFPSSVPEKSTMPIQANSKMLIKIKAQISITAPRMCLPKGEGG